MSRARRRADSRAVSSLPAAQVEDSVLDGIAGVEWTFDHDLSHVFASAGVREDRRGTGDWFYLDQTHVMVTLEPTSTPKVDAKKPEPWIPAPAAPPVPGT